MKRLLQNKLFADFSIIANDGISTLVHKGVLWARAPLLMNNDISASSVEVFCSSKILDFILELVYVGNISVPVENILEFEKFAKSYKIEIQPQPVTNSRISQSSRNYSPENFRKLLDSEQFSDVRFKVGDKYSLISTNLIQKVHAKLPSYFSHKVRVFSREGLLSFFFKLKPQFRFSQLQDERIEMSDLSVDGFSALLEYLFTDQVSFNAEVQQERLSHTDCV